MVIRAPISTNAMKGLIIVISTPNVIIPQDHLHVYVNKERDQDMLELVDKNWPISTEKIFVKVLLEMVLPVSQKQ